MTDVVVACDRCRADVVVVVEATVLRVGVVTAAEGEILFACPVCSMPQVRGVAVEAIAMLLLSGVRPLVLAEPAMEDCDRPPPGASFNRQDLLDWHELLEVVESVSPWE